MKIKLKLKPLKNSLSIIVCLCVVAISANFQVKAQEKFIVVASTTSTVNSGLFKQILPRFRDTTGIAVRVVGVGTGQAVEIAKRGDADVLFVHHEISEIKFVRSGFGVKRYSVMYNDFVLVGPAYDPAGLRTAESVISAYQKIFSTKSTFLSRGDDSGTHKRSLEFWVAALKRGINEADSSWYHEVGAGMGATLNIAREMEAYTLTDRATWEAYADKGSLELLFESDEGMRNEYSVIMVNPNLHKHIKRKLASDFINWLVSSDGQSAIENFKINGRQVFFSAAES